MSILYLVSVFISSFSLMIGFGLSNMHWFGLCYFVYWYGIMFVHLTSLSKINYRFSKINFDFEINLYLSIIFYHISSIYHRFIIIISLYAEMVQRGNRTSQYFNQIIFLKWPFVNSLLGSSLFRWLKLSFNEYVLAS